MSKIASALHSALSDIVEMYLKGFSMFRLAPWVLAIVIIPEFAQHVAEISLGMFDSLSSARALAEDPLRWAFGYVKLAGLMLCFLASARYWWTREQGGSWYDVREIAWGKLSLGLLLFIGIGSIAEPFAKIFSPDVLLTTQVVLSILSLPFLLLVLAGLFGDRSEVGTLKSVIQRAWIYIPLLLVLLVTAYGPSFVLHGLNHKLAMGQPLWTIWLLMIFDSLTVGALAGLTGTAMFLAYRRFSNSLKKVD